MSPLSKIINKPEFCRIIINSEPKHFLCNGGTGNFEWLFSEKDFWRKLLVSARHLKFPDVRLIKDGENLSEKSITELISTEKSGMVRRIDVKKILREFEAGSTINITAIHALDERLYDFCIDLAEETGSTAQINAYYSPPNAQGFNTHFDNHDVIILQLFGTKKWNIAPPTFENPLGEHQYFDFPIPNKFSDSFKLIPGDVLYLPRGYWHMAQTQSDPSLHLTVGLYYRTCIDLIGDATKLLKNHSEMRSKLPRYLDGEDLSEKLSIEIKRILESFLHT
jgi:hypothetical protein